MELFQRLPAGPVPQLIHDAIPDGANILELGAGAGRITRPLIGLGHEVVAVDESPDIWRTSTQPKRSSVVSKNLLWAADSTSSS